MRAALASRGAGARQSGTENVTLSMDSASWPLARLLAHSISALLSRGESEGQRHLNRGRE